MSWHSTDGARLNQAEFDEELTCPNPNPNPSALGTCASVVETDVASIVVHVSWALKADGTC